MRVLCVVAFLAAACTAEHILNYVGYDHVIDYNPNNGAIRAFDMRRQLTPNDTCDFFVYPPLIEDAKFVDVMTLAMRPDLVQVSFLGDEMFMVQDGDTGRYTVRRCSGFMPQQTSLPCEVWAVGHDDFFLAPNRFFFAGDRRVIRFNSNSKRFDLLAFDRDIHGGGNPFVSEPILSSQFEAFGDDAIVDFTYIQISHPPMDLLLAQDEVSGKFKVWKYNMTATSIDGLVGQLVLAGSLLPRYRVKTLRENHVIAYDRTDGDFEIWRFNVVDDKAVIELVKRDTLESGHGCIFHDRQSCVAHKTCGWCADSITCHQLNSDRLPCDGSKCLSIIDEYSPDSKKYQTFENPLPGKVPEFGEEPADNPVSPLRDIHESSAIPIERNNDLQEIEILDGYKVNPSEGIVYVPPKRSDMPCMDDLYQDPRDLPLPDVQGGADKMNAAPGIAVPSGERTPQGEAVNAVKSDCDENTNIIAVKNVTRLGNATAVMSRAPLSTHRLSDKLTYPPEPETTVDSNVIYSPNNLGTAVEEDLMNEVRSHYSSLMPKGEHMAPVRSEMNDPPAPLTEEQVKQMVFKPRDPHRDMYKVSSPVPDSVIPGMSLYSPAQMESVQTVHVTESETFSNRVQQNAMSNAQFKSTSIYTPSVTAPSEVTRENSMDRTGMSLSLEVQLDPRDDEKIIEGTQVKSVEVQDAQEVKVLTKGVSAPKPVISTKELVKEAVAEAKAEIEEKNEELAKLAEQQGIDDYTK